MKLIIDISEDNYNFLKKTGYSSQGIYNAIAKGTPLNEVLDKIKAEIREFSVVGESGTYRIMTYIVNQIIDKYRGEE